MCSSDLLDTLIEETEALKDWFNTHFISEEEFELLNILDPLLKEDLSPRPLILSPADTKMQIFVKTSMNQTITLNVDPYMSLEVVKELISIKVGVPVKEQRLVFNNDQLGTTTRPCGTTTSRTTPPSCCC